MRRLLQILRFIWTQQRQVPFQRRLRRIHIAEDLCLGGVPQALIPAEIGLIVADAYGGEVLRAAQRRPVAAARRKSLLIDCARLASERLARLDDPDFGDIA